MVKIKVLTKAYRLVWNDEKEIIMNDHFPALDGTTHTIHNVFESDDFASIQAKIDELGLVDNLPNY